jgi:hypothetical protein
MKLSGEECSDDDASRVSLIKRAEPVRIFFFCRKNPSPFMP